MQGCECEHKKSMCQCVNWKKDDLAVQVNHLMNYFEFTGFELKYTTLGPEENRRLCKIGRCRICGKRLCLGTKLPDQDSADDLLSEIYRWMFQMWMPCDRQPDGVECFTDLFWSVFHEVDRGMVIEWLNQEARSIIEEGL